MGRPKGTNNKVKKSFTIDSDLWNRLEAEGRGKGSDVVNSALRFWYTEQDRKENEQERGMEEIRRILREEQCNESAKRLVALVADNDEGQNVADLMLPWFGVFQQLCGLKNEYEEDGILGDGEFIRTHSPQGVVETVPVELHIEECGRLILCWNHGEVSLDAHEGTTQVIELPDGVAREGLEDIEIAKAIHAFQDVRDDEESEDLALKIKETILRLNAPEAVTIYRAEEYFVGRDFLVGVPMEEQAIRTALRREFEDCSGGGEAVIGIEEFIHEIMAEDD